MQLLLNCAVNVENVRKSCSFNVIGFRLRNTFFWSTSVTEATWWRRYTSLYKYDATTQVLTSPGNSYSCVRRATCTRPARPSCGCILSATTSPRCTGLPPRTCYLVTSFYSFRLVAGALVRVRRMQHTVRRPDHCERAPALPR